MFGLFDKRGSAPITLEQKLESLARLGLKLASPFTAQDLLESWNRQEFEQPGFDLTLVGLGMTEERPPWRNHCVNAWHFDTECIEDSGSYVRIARRIAELTQGSLVLTNVRDSVDIEGGLATLDFEHSGKTVHIDCKVNDDWVDPTVFGHFVRLLAVADPSKIFLYYDTGGQDCVIACVSRDQFSALKKAGVNFRQLT